MTSSPCPNSSNGSRGAQAGHLGTRLILTHAYLHIDPAVVRQVIGTGGGRAEFVVPAG
jgi:hypothetical protein